MSYTPSTDFLALVRQTSGGARIAEMPGLDFTIATLARAGLITLVVSQTAPTSNQLNTAWFKPAQPSWTAEGVLYLWDVATGAYLPATPALWASLLSGNFTQAGAGAVVRTLQAKARDFVTVQDFGAVGDGVANDTAAFVAAFASGAAHVFVPATAASYIVDPIIITAPFLKHVIGVGRPTIVPGPGVPVGSGFSNWITASARSGMEITGLRFTAPSLTYSGLTVLLLDSCANCMVHGNRIEGAGYNGISGAVGSNNKILRNYVTDYKGNGIIVSGSSPVVPDVGTEIAFNYTKGNGLSSIAHGVVANYAVDFNIHHNRNESAGTFGVACNLSDFGVIDCNISIASIHEGLNVEDSNFIRVRGNVARWDVGGGSGVDFGMSFFGNTRHCIGLDVSGNVVVNSPSSGLCFTGTNTFGVQNSIMRGNTVYGCNQKQAAVAGGSDNLAGILIAASPTQLNAVLDNTVVDLAGKLTYGIAELNRGTGAPSSNTIGRNTISGVTNDVLRSNSSTGIFDNRADVNGRSFTPVITASAGAITTSSATCTWSYDGKFINLRMALAITTNGTGSGAVLATLPATAVSEGGFLAGKEVSVSGKAVTGEVIGAQVSVRFYDNSYPGADGALIELSGRYEVS